MFSGLIAEVGTVVALDRGIVIEAPKTAGSLAIGQRLERRMSQINCLSNVAKETVECVDYNLNGYLVRAAHDQRFAAMFP